MTANGQGFVILKDDQIVVDGDGMPITFATEVMANLAANQRRKWAASLGQKIEYRVVPMRYSITAVGADNAELDPSEADTELELPSVPAKAESEVG